MAETKADRHGSGILDLSLAQRKTARPAVFVIITVDGFASCANDAETDSAVCAEPFRFVILSGATGACHGFTSGKRVLRMRRAFSIVSTNFSMGAVLRK